MGHTKAHSQKEKQSEFFKTHWRHRYQHGGVLRQKRKGRQSRPLSTRDPLHIVFKAHRHKIRGKSLRTHRNFILINEVIRKYASKFGVKVEQISIQGDHLHLLIRCSKRVLIQYFFRVVAGQIVQRLVQMNALVTDTKIGSTEIGSTQKKKTKLWRYRPFSRVVIGFKAYRVVKNYIQLNAKEATGKIKYNPRRLAGLSSGEWEILWA